MGEEIPPVARLISVSAGVCADAEVYVREARPHWDWGGCTVSLGALGSLTQINDRSLCGAIKPATEKSKQHRVTRIQPFVSFPLHETRSDALPTLLHLSLDFPELVLSLQSFCPEQVGMKQAEAAMATPRRRSLRLRGNTTPVRSSNESHRRTACLAAADLLCRSLTLISRNRWKTIWLL